LRLESTAGAITWAGMFRSVSARGAVAMDQGCFASDVTPTEAIKKNNANRGVIDDANAQDQEAAVFCFASCCLCWKRSHFLARTEKLLVN